MSRIFRPLVHPDPLVRLPTWMHSTTQMSFCSEISRKKRYINSFLRHLHFSSLSQAMAVLCPSSAHLTHSNPEVCRSGAVSCWVFEPLSSDAFLLSAGRSNALARLQVCAADVKNQNSLTGYLRWVIFPRSKV